MQRELMRVKALVATIAESVGLDSRIAFIHDHIKRLGTITSL